MWLRKAAESTAPATEGFTSAHHSPSGGPAGGDTPPPA
jgi:hypothetical protein